MTSTAVSSPPLASNETARDRRLLHAAATLFALAVLFHNSDHLRRGGDSVAADVFVAGSLAIVLEVGAVALVYMRHHWAPLAAVAAGFPLALGYLVVHFTPERSLLNDSLVSGNAAAVSIVAATLETVTALLLGLAGLNLLRKRGGLVSAATPAGDVNVGALRHPVVVVMALANVVIFVASLAQR